jgi:hypothetical protein
MARYSGGSEALPKLFHEAPVGVEACGEGYGPSFSGYGYGAETEVIVNS